MLDYELWVELKEDQSTYDQYNKVQNISTAIIIYDEEKPIACGCFKEHDDKTIEIKRMFVDKVYRGKGISKLVLNELEKWAIEKGFRYSILETSIRFDVAKSLYRNAGYFVIDNYDQYKGLEESVCMKKKLG
ncbi:MAG TPA: GNAT family N-acetyltransferase [Parafilimonas sp.]